MVERKFNKVLTVILVIIIIAILVALGFWIYDLIQRYTINSGANEAVEEFDKKISELNNVPVQNIIQPQQKNTTQEQQQPVRNENNNQSSTSYTTPSNQIQLKYKGYDVVGKIEIPATDLSYPILGVATATSMNASVGVIYGPGPNKVGNTVIMGHNYRNGTFFSDNDKLTDGDKIYITDLSGNRVEYVIYNKYYTTSVDFDYATRETSGRREITLESCTDDSKSRVIIWAKEV